MAEYIKREAAIKAMEKANYTAIADDADSCKSDYLREIIENVPAADVVPVVHGKWISFLDGDHIVLQWFYRCSHCGRVESRRHPYCHCGAKMDGGNGNEV